MYYGIENPHGGDIYGKEIKLDFSANVNPYGTPPSVTAAAKEALEDMSLYPDPYCRGLVKALSGVLGLPQDMIYIGSGASELIYAYCRASSFGKALVVSPTFLEYTAALESAGTEVLPYVMKKEDGFAPDEGLTDHIRSEKPDAVFICNPNNPTGITVPDNMMHAILEAASDIGASLFVDECFFDLSDERITLKNEIPRHKNLFILRAFTKSYALASLRLGYCLCSDAALFGRMSSITPPWSVSGPAQAAGIAALAETDFPIRSSEKIRAERRWLSDELSKAGIAVWKSDVNYIFIEAREDLQERLREQGIEIRSCSNYTGLGAGYFRIAVRRHEDNEILVKAIKKL